MSDHTLGRLTYIESGEANKYTLIDNRERWLISMLHNGEQLVHTQRENLRRIVACWNACDGMRTESMEELSTIGGLPALIVYGDELRRERNHAIAQRDELLKTLRYIKLAAMDISCERAAIRDAARAAIAKAEGMQ